MADEQPPMATPTPPHVPVRGNPEALDQSARAERRRQRLELEEIATGSLGATREEGAAMEDDFVLVDEPPPPLEEVGPSNPLEASPPSDPPEGSEMDHLVQRLADLQANGDVAATRLSATEERLRFSEQRAQFLERESDLLRQINDRHTGAGPSTRAEVRTSGPLKTAPPKEYSHRNNIGPSKWLFQMEMYFEYASIPEGEKVRHAMIQLKDAAEAWWRSHIQETSDSQGLPTADRMTAWADFSTRLKVAFTPVPEEKLARNRLYSLRQTGSVQMYTQSFRELTFILPDLSRKESMQLYERGLQSRILNEIYLKEPVNVDEMIQLAERVDALKPGVGHAGPSMSRSGLIIVFMIKDLFNL